LLISSRPSAIALADIGGPVSLGRLGPALAGTDADAGQVGRARNQFVPDMWPTTGRQIVERLCRHYGIDVFDRRQLNYLMQSLGLFTSALASTALDLDGSLVLQP
jgi:hypothetical protein